MDSYKPGQVSALLFSGNKKTHKNTALASLFTVNKREASSKPCFPPSKRENQNGEIKTPSGERKVKQDAFREKVKKRKRRLKVSTSENASQVTKDEAEEGQANLHNMPYLHETLTHKGISGDKSKNDSTKTPKNVSLKRKRQKEDKEEEEKDEKRLRRNRKRDKRADKRTIFIGNCPLSADKKTLRNLFKEFGDIESIRLRCAPAADPNLPRRAIVITKNFHNQGNNCVAYIVFKDEKSAGKSLIRNGYILNGLHLRVDVASNSRKHDKKRSVFVGNLPFTITEETIRSHFSDCGDINNVRIVRDRQTSLGKGICYVQFETKDSASLALKLNMSEIEGRKARVMACTSKAKQEEIKRKENKSSKQPSGDKTPDKKPAFGPSNATNSLFRKKLQIKKEKRMRKKEKAKKAAKKTDGLAAIFGEASSVTPPKKKPKLKGGNKSSGTPGGIKGKIPKSKGSQPRGPKGNKLKGQKGNFRRKQ